MSVAPTGLDRTPAAAERPSLEQLAAAEQPYLAYTYSYPHKTAYRAFAPRPLAEVWQGEKRDALFLYLHVPFCASRCGYCNLFSHACVDAELTEAYVRTVERQVVGIRDQLGQPGFARVAIGGGTPTQLQVDQLARLLDLIEGPLGASLSRLPSSVETSPTTASADRLALLRQRGVERVSIGVQSFVADELTALGRREGVEPARQALARIKQAGFATLNIDLIYGVAGQSVASWLTSLDAALQFEPEELYLYPLYVRPLTGLGSAGRQWQDLRLDCYRAGRDLLAASGYQQLSMRMFRRQGVAQVDGPVYRCQEDGMVGLGCGARSYTRDLHYSDEWAVGAHGVRQILRRWVERPDRDFASAWYGYQLDATDRQRRYLLKSLFQVEGLDLDDYRAALGGEALEHSPQLQQLLDHGLAEQVDGRLRLTSTGLELSDTLGPWLYSDRVLQSIEGFELR